MRKKMDREMRAKQFMPFAALKGFDEALRAKERIIVKKEELSEEMKEELDYTMAQINRLDKVRIVYYSGDEYVEVRGIVTKLDKEAKYITVVDRKITFDNIYSLEKLDS